MWLVKLKEIIRWLLVFLSAAVGVYAVVSIRWGYVLSHPTDLVERHLMPSLAVSVPFLFLSYVLARRQYRKLAIFGCIMGGLCIPWLTCLIFKCCGR